MKNYFYYYQLPNNAKQNIHWSFYIDITIFERDNKIEVMGFFKARFSFQAYIEKSA
jgi:hypothetical protein